jgi:hypothetical protein
MTIRLLLADHGRTFATRGRATEMREQVSADLARDGHLVIDFAGVTNITYSFADELVGKLIAENDGRVEPVNMDPLVASTVARAVERRTHVGSTC